MEAFTSDGGAGTIAVTTTNTWTAGASDTWIQITSGTGGTGDGMIGYTVDANTDAGSRSGAITVDGETFMVYQCGAGGILEWSESFDGGPSLPWLPNVEVGSNLSADFVNDRLELTAADVNPGAQLFYGVMQIAGDSYFQGRVQQINTGDIFIASVVLRGNADSGTGYVANVYNGVSPNIAIYKIPAGPGSGVLLSSQPLSIDLSDFQIKFSAVGTQLQAKVWPNGAAEPETWDVTAADGDFPIGGCAVGVMAGSATSARVAFDDVLFSTDFSVPCAYAISAETQFVAAAGGNASVDVTASCPWTAVSNAAWIQITAGNSGAGDGSVNYTVAANSAVASRSCNITVAGQTHTVYQCGTGGVVEVSDTFNGGLHENWQEMVNLGDGSFALAANDQFELYAQNSATDEGQVVYGVMKVAADSIIEARIREISAGDVFRAHLFLRGNPETGTTYFASVYNGPTPWIYIYKATAGPGTVTTLASAPLSGDFDDLHLKFAAIGSQLYAKAWETGQTEPEAWQVTVADSSYAIGCGAVGVITGGATSVRAAFDDVTLTTEIADVCTYSLSSGMSVYTESGGSGSVNVTTETPGFSTCAWSAETAESWISITGGATGEGDGAVAYTVAANPDAASRSGIITVAGNTFTVYQSGAGGVPLFGDSFDGGASSSDWVEAVNIGVGNHAEFTNDRIEFHAVPDASQAQIYYGVLNVATDCMLQTRVQQIVPGDVFTASAVLRGNPESDTGYVVTVYSGVYAGISIYRVTAGYGSGDLLASQPLTMDLSDFQLKYAAIGPNLYAKVWPTGAAEPDAWQVSATDATFDVGGFAIGLMASPPASAQVAFDDVAFTTDMAALCTYTLGAATRSFDENGGTGSFSVMAYPDGQAICAWTAISSEPWLSIQSGASGSGDGTVGYEVAPYTGTAARTGAITVAGQTLKVKQNGQALWSEDFDGGVPDQSWLFDASFVDAGDTWDYQFVNNRCEMSASSSAGPADKYLTGVVDTVDIADAIIEADFTAAPGSHYFALVGLRCDAATASGYGLAINDYGYIWIGKRIAGAAEALVVKQLSTFDPDNCRLKFAAIGDKLFGKVWTAGTSEPESWQIECTDTELSSGYGGIGLATWEVNPYYITGSNGAFDDVSLYAISNFWTESETATGSDIASGETEVLNVGGSTVEVTSSATEDKIISVEESTETPFEPAKGIFSGEMIDRQVKISSNLADGEHQTVVKLSYTDADVEGIDELSLRLMYWNDANSSWRLAVSGNTNAGDPGAVNWLGDSPPTQTLGDHGVDTVNNILWAVVDHYSDFAGGVAGVSGWSLQHNNRMLEGDDSQPETTVNLASGASYVWVADVPAASETTYPNEAWSGQLNFSTIIAGGHSFTIEVGFSADGSAGGFVAGPPAGAITGDGLSRIYDFDTGADGVLTVSAGHYVALRVANTSPSAYALNTGGLRSWLNSPAVDTLTVLKIRSAASAGSPVFTDDSAAAHTIAAYGDVQHTAAGTDTTILFDGAGDYLGIADSPDWDLGTDDFTVELWAYFPAAPDASTPAGLLSTQSAGTEYGYRLEVVNGLISWYSRGPESAFRLSSGVAPEADAWYHVAAVRSGDTLTLYVNGEATATRNLAGDTMNTAGGGLVIGRIVSGTDDFYFNGQMDEIVVTKGEARWAGNFTPDNYPFYADTDGDGLFDIDEAQYGTDPNIADSDNDGIDDGAELAYWGDPGYLVNHDGDAVDNNLLDPDSDNDGAYDGEEIAEGVDPSDPASLPTSERLFILSADTPGSTAFVDSSPLGHVITAYGDVQHTASGPDTAMLFDGSGDYLGIADSGDWDFGTGAFTIEMWVKFQAVPDASTAFGLLSTQSAGTEYGYRLEVVNGLLSWYSRSPETAFRLSSDVAPEADVWYHLAAVRSGDTLTLYVDGEAKAVRDVTGVTMDTAGGGLVIGRIVSGTDGYYFNGQMDAVAVFRGEARWTADFTPDNYPDYPDADEDGLLDIEEAVYGTDPNVADSDGDGMLDGAELAYWGDPGYLVNYDGDAIENNLLDPDADEDGVTDGEEFVEGSDPSDPLSLPSPRKLYLQSAATPGSTDFTDSSNLAHEITAYGDVHHADSGLDTTILFDGDGDYLSLADSNAWDLGTENFTIEMWVSFPVVPDASAPVGLLSTQSAGTEYGYRLEVVNGLLSWYSRSPETAFRLSSNVAPEANAWYHVAAVRSGDTLTLYVNGEAKATRNLTGVTMNTAGGGLVVGRIVSGVDGYYFNGQMDELSLYKGEALWTENFVPENDPDYPDTDGDGLSDPDETLYGTDPAVPDSDADGIDDGEELAYWGDPGYLDNIDGDAVDNNLLDPDSDGDGVNDGEELVEGSDPSDPLSLPATERLYIQSSAVPGSTVFTDSSSVGHNIVAHGDVQHTASGSDTTILFDGSGDYLELADSGSWDLGANDFTIQLWVRFPAVPGASSPLGLLSTQSAGTEYGYRFEVVNGMLSWFSRSPEAAFRLSSNIAPEADVWYHLAAVRSGDTLTLYVNGEAKATRNLAGVSMNTAGGGLVVGRIVSGTDGYYFNGQMDEISLYKGEALWTDEFTPENSPAETIAVYIDANENGIYDDGEGAFDTLSEAVAAAAAGQTLRVSNGVHLLLATLTIDKTLSIIGESEAGVVIDASGNGNGYGIEIDADDVVLQNFTLLPPGDGATPPASGGYAIHATFDHLTPTPHTNLTLSGITIENGYRTAFDIHGYDGVTLTNLTARNAAYGNGISLTGCTGAVVTGCVTENNAWGGIAFYVSSSSYLNRGCSGITFDMAANSIGEFAYVEDEFGILNDVTVQNAAYLIRNDYAGDAAMRVYTDQDQAAAGDIATALNTKYGNTLSLVQDLSDGSYVVVSGLSIQAAIDAAGDGDTIEVGAGVYDETLNIESRTGLTLTGVDRDMVILRSGATLPWNVGAYGTSRQAVVRNVNAGGITFRNLTIDMDQARGNHVFALMGWDSAVTIDNIVLKNNQLDDASGGYYEFGCYFRTDSAYTETDRADIVITNSIFENAGRVAVLTHNYINALISGNQIYKTVDDFGYGVEIGSESVGTISDNVFYGFDKLADSDGSDSAAIYIENAFTSGVSLAHPKTVTVENNEIYGCQYGMWIGNGYDGLAGNVDIAVTLNNNDIYDNSSLVNPDPVMYADKTTGGVIIQDEDAADGSSVTVTGTGNTIAGNGDYGIWVFSQGDGIVTVALNDQVITGNATGVYVSETAAGSAYSVAVNNSNIFGNTVYGVNNTIPALTVNAESNWWGAPDGPGGAGSGSGDAVSDYVDYDPIFYAAYIDANTNGIYDAGESVFPFIQDAIDAASGGDVVNVVDGTHTGAGNKNIDFGGKALTLQSENGPDNCVIDAQNDGRGFYFHSGEGAGSVVSGITVVNGNVNGGGVHCLNSSPTITNCVLTDNAAILGAGIYCENASPVISGCRVADNAVAYGRGGGLYCSAGSNPVVTGSVFEGNHAVYGMGITLAFPFDIAIVIGLDTEHAGGGGIYCVDSSPTFNECIIRDNRAISDYQDSVLPLIPDVYYPAHGGGVYCNNASPAFTNCLIVDNDAVFGSGGGVYCVEGAAPTLMNCTLSGNTATNYMLVATGWGGAIYAFDSAPVVVNSILWNNMINEVDYNLTPPDITCSNIAGGYAGTGNISQDPLFADPAGGDYHLYNTSPCIDAGTSAGAPAVDFDGDARPQGAAVDMGIDEFFFDVPGTFATVEEAVQGTQPGNTIYVAPGTYPVNLVIDHHISLVGAGADTVLVKNTYDQVVLISCHGYSDTEKIVLKDLRIETDNIPGVYMADANGAFLEMDNVTVSGLAVSKTENECGFKVATYASLTNAVFKNCTFENLMYGWYLEKHGDWTGGSTVSNVTVENTSFTNNSAKGIYAEKLSDAVFTNVTVADNGLDTTFWNAKWNGGIDINLKAGNYANLTFNNLTVVGNGLECEEGAGLMIKARDDGATYGAYPASLTNVTINGGLFMGNERGIRFGEPGMNNLGPTAVVIADAAIENNVTEWPTAPGLGFGLINETQTLILAENNWWGAVDGPGGLGSGSGNAVTGYDVDFDPWLTAAP